MNDIFNFSAGPAMLPREVLDQIDAELKNWHNLNVSVMEISHRSDEFHEIVYNSEHDLRELLNIPNVYKVLFCHGGARTQFSSVPMNLLGGFHVTDYINSGYWSRSAAQEAEKYCKVNLINVSILDENHVCSVKNMKDWPLSSNSAYLHYCPNETIDGVAIHEQPEFNDSVVVVGDFSSTLLSAPINVNCFGMIYAAAQKNIGLPGLTIVIIREDLLNRECHQVPSTLQYSILNNYKSMFNTPPTFSWYVAGLIFKWIKRHGGLIAMSLRNIEKANLLYEAIDSSDYYYNNIAQMNRSYMNVPFYLHDEKLNDIFLQESNYVGLYALKGHRSVGGMRASLYNSMPLQGVEMLVEFMEWFAKKYG
ncbi:3-phosphoserine/phosphohydroxythreonine transaminase [Blochmannia endosymbiont of Polyrhachis (Hedomyrma) turneri]|uniref:3-phosphoserine/phosphohydroxythreonine transaminase n=1 Tax=Blochmannia endosymbiont of Polyrhachis (Hedomyrma) turneri TaxID=1505596 RepID=UPI00061A5916|nr:3-phosphoserine/phosphohydroxythreonine transaminase [Blochmannia endosymbiont of Polyrhachis (Hedomyrma) turneri]AKC59948.1 Phosphoserine aminotransferase [Blochmannia endosymbiont of Polyrhachis (Hedomyrma) turneri]